MGIRTKLIGILAVATLVPSAVAIGLIWTFGYGYHRRERGVTFQRAAAAVAQQVDLVLDKQVEGFSDWVSLSPLRDQLAEINERFATWTDTQVESVAQAMEARWPQLTAADPELSELLTNVIARQLRDFQRACPLFAEIFVTDRWGRLVAATGKTSDYWQADERWWQMARELPAGRAYVEGVQYDESAGVYSVDVALPVRHVRHANESPAGVIKGVIDASPLFASTPLYRNAGGLRQLVVLGDGRILASLDGSPLEPLRQQMPPLLMEQIRRRASGWVIAKVDQNRHLLGFAPLRSQRQLKGETVLTGLQPMFAVVMEEVANVLAPIRWQFWWLTLCAGVLVAGFSLLGYYLADRQLVRPIRSLRAAAQVVAASARTFDTVSSARRPLAASGKSSVLADVEKIRTGDELQALAEDFATMAGRVLSYQEHLEAEIAEKTAEIRRDLEFAREFQEALMPQRYPQLPRGSGAGRLAVNFHHVYVPARTVGGDFFDVLKLDDHRAGVFVADVMGHGARSALVTAMLRALLHDLAEHAGEPGQFVGMLNRQFYNLVQQSRQFIFVSAVYLLVDIEQATATVTVAGHPSPLLVRRRARRVSPLLGEQRGNPALGLLADATYGQYCCPLMADDLVLLFTDGIVEARSPAGEEFGCERLVSLLEWHMQLPAMQLTETILERVQQFTHGQPWADDICLVAVELSGETPPAETGQVTFSKAASPSTGSTT